MALPALAIPAVMGIMRFAASRGAQQAIKKYGRQLYNDALAVAKDKGSKGQQVRQQLQRMAEKSDEAAKSIPKPVRDLMIPKGSNKVPARKEAPMRAERDTPVTPKRESTRARVAERKERQRTGAERKAAEQSSRSSGSGRKNASATTAGVAGATAIASSVSDKPKKSTRTGGGRGDGAAEVRARKAEADRRNNKSNNKPKQGSKGKNYNVGVSKGGVPFKEAFRHFRNKGAKTFSWNGKKYTTELKEEKKK